MTTKELAAELKISTRKLRRILRSIARWDDGVYTRYKLGKNDLNQVSKKVVSIETGKPAKKKAAKRVRKTTAPVVENTENVA